MNNTQASFSSGDRVTIMEAFSAKITPPWGGDWYSILIPRLTTGYVANSNAYLVKDLWWIPVTIDNDDLEVIKQNEPAGSFTPPDYWLPAELLSKPEEMSMWRWPHWD